MTLAAVHTLFEQNANDIAAMLRKAADTIEGETDNVRTKCIVAVQMGENGTVQIYGWGQVDSMQAMGVLAVGMNEMTANHVSRG